jgi:hypothetical protein
MGLHQFPGEGNDPLPDLPNLILALQLAAKGMFVFPCLGKQPALTLRWRNASTCEEPAVRKLWAVWPMGVPAIDLGKSKLFVPDCDLDGMGHDVRDGWAWLVGYCPEAHREALQCVPGSITPSGGRHPIFRNVEPALGNGRGSLPAKNVANIDPKGDGGYVIAPGADTSPWGGGVYHQIGDLMDIPPLPDWLRDLMAPRKPWEREKAKPSGNGRAEPAEVPDDRKSAWGEAALEAIAAELTAAQKGELHNTANLCGFKAGQLVGGGCLSKDEACARLEAAALAGNFPAGDRALGSNGTIMRAIEDGTRSPRRPGDKDDIGGVVINLGERKRREEWAPGAEQAQSRWCRHGEEETDVVHKWLIEGLLPESGVVMLSGQPKKGKSITALDMFGSIATTLDFIDYKVTCRGGVLFLALPTEGADDIAIRLRALIEGKLRKAAADLAEPLPEGFLDKLPISWLREGQNDFSLQDKISIEKLIADIEAESAWMLKNRGVPVRLIVVDALEAAAKFSKGYPANEAKAVMAILELISMRTKTCVMALDHFGKDEEQGPLGSIHKSSGAKIIYCIRGNTFSIYQSRITKSGPETARKFKLRTVKFSDGGSSFCIDWKPHGKFEGEAGGEDDPIIGGMVAAGKARRDAEARWPKPLRAFRRAMQEVMEHGLERRPAHDKPMVRSVTLEAVRTRFQASKIGDSQEAIRKAFARALDRVDAELLVLKFNIDGVDYLYFANKEDDATKKVKIPD